MKHAYLIMAHTDFALLKTLITMLDDVRNDIYLHVDKKAKDFAPAMFSTSKAKLHILEKRLDVRWGHYSQIKLEMLLFETAHKNGPYAYYHLLSGMDLPLKSQDYIHDFFTQNSGKEFVGFWNNLDWQAHFRVSQYFFFMQYEKAKNRYIQIFFSKLRRFIRKNIHKITKERKTDFTCKKGPNWVSITHNFCNYLLLQKEFILKRFKYTQNGDEVFLQTVIWNSPFKEKLYDISDTDNGCMREIDWERGTISSPYTWREEDAEFLMSSEKLFARKFSNLVDKKIINKIKNHVEK